MSDSDEESQPGVRPLSLQVVTNRGEKFEFVVEPATTVGELRTIVREMGGGTSGSSNSLATKMSIRGVQLIDDNAKWSQLPLPHSSMTDGEKLYVHFSSAAAAERRSGSNIPAGASNFMFDPNGGGAPPGASAAAKKEADNAARARARMMEPIVDSMVRNPAFVDSLISSQPELKSLIQEHPQVEQELRNPETLKQMLMSQIDPDKRKEVNRAMQLQLAQLSNVPGGTAMLERYMAKALEQPEGKRSAADLRDAVEEHSRPDPSLSSNDAALPNPWARSQSSVGAGMFPTTTGGRPHATMPPSLPPFGAQAMWPPFPSVSNQQQNLQHLFRALPQPPVTVREAPPVPPPLSLVPPERAEDDDYSEQLVVLLEMGFEDDEACMRALRACHGNIDAAVCRLGDEADAAAGSANGANASQQPLD